MFGSEALTSNPQMPKLQGDFEGTAGALTENRNVVRRCRSAAISGRSAEVIRPHIDLLTIDAIKWQRNRRYALRTWFDTRPMCCRSKANSICTSYLKLRHHSMQSSTKDPSVW